MVVEREVESFADIADNTQYSIGLRNKPFRLRLDIRAKWSSSLQTCSHYPLCSGSTLSLKFTDKMYSSGLIYI